MNQAEIIHEFNNRLIKIAIKDKRNIEYKFDMKLIDLLNESNHKLVLFVFPDGFCYERMFLYYQAILKLYVNSIDEKRKVFDEIEIDDLILFKKKKYKVVSKLSSHDMETISIYLSKSNERYIKVEDKNGAFEYISEAKDYLVVPYNGDSTSLNQIGKKSKKYKGIDNLIIDTFNLKNNAYNTLVNETLLFVTSKNKTEEYIDDIFIDFGGDLKHFFTEVVPTSYYSNYDNEHRFKGNSAQKKSILKMSSNLDTAYEIMKINKEIKSFIINSSEVIGFNENTLLKILSRKQIDKGVILANYSELGELENFFDNKEFKTKIIGAAEIDFDLKGCYINERIFQKFINKKIIVNEVDFESDILFVDVYCKIKKINNYYGINNKIAHIVRLSYSILKSLRGYVHIANSNNGDSISSKIMNLKVIISENENFINDIERQLIQEIIEILSILFTNIKRENSIFKIIDHKIKYSNQDILFVFPNNIITHGLNAKYSTRKSTRKVNFKTLNMIKANEFYDEIIVFSIKYGDEYRIFSLNNSSKIQIFEYPHRKQNIDFLLRKYYNILGQKEFEMNNIKNCIEFNEIKDEKDLELLMNEISFENSIEYFIDKMKSCEESNQVSCSIFLDCENHFGFYNKNYKVYTLDRINQEIISKEVQHIKLGDEIIFLSEEFREGDFLEGLISKLLENKQFENRYSEKIRISKIWSEQLLLIKNNNKLTYKKLAKMFKNEGIEMTPGAISNWVNSDYLVGTKEKEVYRIISKYSTDEYYKSNWEKVYDACNEIRSMHVKLRHEFASEIINGLTRSQESNNILRYLPIGKENFVETSVVSAILTKNVQLPYSNANKMRLKGE